MAAVMANLDQFVMADTGRISPADVARYTAQSGMELDGRAPGPALVSNHAAIPVGERRRLAAGVRYDGAGLEEVACLRAPIRRHSVGVIDIEENGDGWGVILQGEEAVTKGNMLPPLEYLKREVLPAFEDFRVNPLSERHARIAARAISDHLEWTYKFYLIEDVLAPLKGAKSLSDFRTQLFAECPELRIMWDISDASKHRLLTSRGRTVATSTDAYVVRDGELWVTGYERQFRPALTAAVTFWIAWPG